MRGDFPLMDGIRDAFHHPEWMEVTSILSTVALWIIALTLIALAVRAYLNASRAHDQIGDTLTPPASKCPPLPAAAAVQTATPEAPTEPMPQGPPPVAPEGETARQVLDRRYAAGELDRDEYLARRDDID